MNCARDPGAPIGIYPLRKAKLKVVKPKTAGKAVKKKKESLPLPAPDGDEDDDEVTGGKRKVVGKSKNTGMFCCRCDPLRIDS